MKSMQLLEEALLRLPFFRGGLGMLVLRLIFRCIEVCFYFPLTLVAQPLVILFFLELRCFRDIS